MSDGTDFAVVKEFYDSFVRGDIDAVIATLSEDLDWRESENFLLGDRNPYLSPAAVVEGVFGRIAKEFQDYQAGPTELIDGGNVVVAVGRSKGIMASTGKPFDAQYMHVVRVANGKIVSFHQLIDTLEIWRSQQID
ncbi:nuclear transport factor 2 family protein [Rhizobium sp. BE258]|jgi:ketosteroid isomerase-like protein|uniref:nuclear transport factor 2 family protein n=1 Tax=Rhizobium sp. BE258 TaxID=2817722 RepID=UPI00285448A9|nr:nuclear transport factor 2 family protein [Rhizobium sp. BE258]MDR7147668.1 ketosteroid isomerase-like protein [Rhizobium sp. BE258]